MLAGILAGTAAPARAQARATLQPFDAASLAAIKARYIGRPFILALWSVHCAPCLQDMATWRVLAKRFPDIPVVLVATDPPAEHPVVRRTLERFAPGAAEPWAFADAFDERNRHSIDPKWRGELPRTYLFDRSHRVEVATGRMDVGTAEAWCARAR